MANSYEFSPQIYRGTTAGRPWLMSHGERSALLQILRCSQPVSALEVGTAHGGSLEQIRQFAQLTYSIDIDPGVRTRLAPEMPNVEFLTGDSAELIGVALQRCAERRQPPGFALIDGDHRYAGVQADIHALLRHQPSCPLWVLLHDSTNPECRRGIAEARWGDNPHVHLVDLDFVTGTTSNDAHLEGQMWGGLALALLLPEPRGGALEIAASASKNFRVLYGASVHSPISWQHWRQILLSKWGGVRRRLGRWR